MSGPFRLPPPAPGIEVEPYVADKFAVPERKGTRGNGKTTGTSWNISLEPDWEASDYVIVQLQLYNGAVPTGVPTGFALIGHSVHPDTGNCDTLLYGGFLGDLSALLFTWSGSTRTIYIATALSGIDPVQPVHGDELFGGTYGSPGGQIGPFEVAAPEGTRGLFGVMAVTRTALGSGIERSWEEPTPINAWTWTISNRFLEFVTVPLPGESKVARSPFLNPWPSAVSASREATGVYLVLRKQEKGVVRRPPVPDLSSVTTTFESPSLIYCLTRDGVEVDGGVLGEPNTTTSDNGVPMTMDTVVSFFSVSKIITEAAIRRLEQEAKLDLDAPALDYLPAHLVAAAHSTFAPVTIRQLLQMRSGYSNASTTYDIDAYNLVAATEAWIGHPFNHVGSYRYENGCWAVLDFIVREVSGAGYWDYVNQIVFKPLRMDSMAAQINMQGTPLWTTSAAAADYSYPAVRPCTAVMGWAGPVRDMVKLAHIFNTELVLDAAHRQAWLDDKTRMRPVAGRRAAAYRHTGGSVTAGGLGARAQFYVLDSGYALALAWNAGTAPTNAQVADVVDSFLVEGP